MNFYEYFWNKYNPQFDYYIEHIILQSGLILDEDMESFLSNYTFKHHQDINKNPTTTTTTKIVLSNLIISGTFFVMGKYYSSLGLISLTPSILISVNRLRNYLQKRKHKVTMNQLIENLRNLLKQNRIIHNYLKERNLNSHHQDDKVFDTSYNKAIEDLMLTVLTEEINMIKLLINNIKHIYQFIPILEDEYAYLENIDFESFQINQIQSIDDCLININKLSDILILVTSNFLISLGFTFCINLWNNTVTNAMEMLNIITPKTTINLQQCLRNIQRNFDNVKYHLIKIRHNQIQLKRNKDFISSKLHNSLVNSMLRIPVILEKSQNILQQLTEINIKNSTEKINLGNSLQELHRNTNEYCESLDILCKLYHVSLHIPSQEKQPSTIENRNETTTKDIKILTLSSDYFNEPLEDEIYELFTSSDNAPFEAIDYVTAEEEAGAFFSLLNQELKQSLKTHKKFMAAKEKHGIVDEVVDKKVNNSPALPLAQPLLDSGLEEEESKILMPPPPPPQPLILTDAGKEEETKILMPPPPPPLQLLIDAGLREMPPPPPPPMLNKQPDVNGKFSTKGQSVADSIKAISLNRNFVEDVFEDSSEEFEDDTE